MNTFESLGIKITGRGNQQKTLCPKCSHNRKNKNDHCLSVNLSEGVYNCHHCGWTGNINQRQYERPPQTIGVKKQSPYSEKVLNYFKSRGISEDSLKAGNVTEGLEWMPGAQKEVETLQFNYLRDDEVVNIKYRSAGKNFKLFKNAELVFYNLDGIKDEETCIITEGEIDALSYIEIGMTNVVSVPNGAGSKNLDFYMNCRSYFDNKLKVYLSIDNDEAGLFLRDELIKRIGVDRCVIVHYPEGCKDANDVLVRHGADTLRKLIHEAKHLPVGDVIYVNDIRDKLIDNFLNGTSEGTTTYFPSVDPHFKWLKGEVTLLTGIPGHGKSKFLKQLMLIKSIKEKTKWAIFTPEEYPPTYFYSDLVHSYLGKNVEKKYRNQCTLEEYQTGLNFINDHFFFIYPENKLVTPSYINNKFRELIDREGIDGAVIDPFNQLDNDFVKAGRDDYYISNFLANEKKFALTHNFLKLIVIHPKQLSKNKDGRIECPTAFDLHGGAMWNNKCDNILAVHRPDPKAEFGWTKTEFHSHKIKKQSLVGKPGMVELDFIPGINRYVEANGFTPFREMEEFNQQQII